MSTNVVNSVAYLRTTREFPEEMHQLSVECNKAYLDTANAINLRTIGIFPTNRPAITGEAWFLLGNKKQQSLRQVYTFTTTADIPLGFKIASIDQFSRFDGLYLSIVLGVTSWYGLIPATNVAITGQITFFIIQDITNPNTDLIRFIVGAGAPALTSGKVVIEWLSDP